MLMIVAHHFVLGFGAEINELTTKSVLLSLFGMWGKTGINCFMLITGYFMCTSQISVRKFVKLMQWIYLYRFLFYGIFLVTGYEYISALRLLRLVMPVWTFEQNFTSCFIVFWLTIPFWNMLIQSMTKKQHQLLLLLLLGMYTILGTIPKFGVSMNYVTWFGIIYLIASYIRLYPTKLMDNTRFWGWMSGMTITIACILGIGASYVVHKGFTFFVSDCNKLFAVVASVTTFLYFKNLSIPHRNLINAIGGSTFGVLLIHANSDAMRQWLWRDIVNCMGHYDLPLMELIFFSVGVVLAIFFTCILRDRVRFKLIEEPFFKYYDKRTRFQKLTSLLSQN